MRLTFDASHPPRSAAIDVSATWELNYWAERWRVEPVCILEAIRQVGTNLRVLEAHVVSRRNASGVAVL